jgi:hypothetical protein
MSNQYEFDIFLSYRHRDPVLTWVKNHFLPLLEQWLPESLPIEHQCRIFVDFQIETGQDWPNSLSHALKHSRCLVPILSPEYFRSSWCRSEWETMLARERELGFRTPDNQSTLIYPVRFFDGEHFPPEASNMQSKDLSDWNYPVLSFSQTVAFLDFINAVKVLSKELARIILNAPGWRQWPISLIDTPSQLQAMQIPRIR